MRKFTLTMIAALMAVVAFGQNKVSSVPQFEVKAFTGIKTEMNTRKFNPVKGERIESLNDLTGTWKQLYYSYFDEAYAFSTVTIELDPATPNGIILKGWWGSFAKDLKATVDLASNKISIPSQSIYEYPGDGSATFVNGVDPTADFEASIGRDGSITFDSESYWGAQVDGTEAFYVIGLGTALYRPSGKMEFTSSGKRTSVDLYIEQDKDTVYVGDFGGWGTLVEVVLKSDRTFEIAKQLISSSSNGDFYLYGLSDDASEIFDPIVGVGDETTLTISSHWTAYAEETSYWYGDQGPATITLTDGTEFVYPDATAINAITNQSAASVSYVDLTGRQVGADAKGLVIKTITYADGSKKSVKVIRK